MKTLVKKLLPARLKSWLGKKNAGPVAQPAPQYIIHISDVDSLAGMRVFVTGATGAIGSSLCRRLLLAGATVGLCGRSPEKLAALAARLTAEVKAGSGTLVPFKVDVLDDAALEAAIDGFARQAGGLDAMVNNAGGSARGESREIAAQSMQVVDDVLALNLRASIVGSRKAAQIMIGQGRGRIINLSSVVGMQGARAMTDYAAAKAGIIGFTKSLAIELGRHNITVNCVSPGMVNQVPHDAGMPVRETGKNCLQRFGYTDEVVEALLFLLAPKAGYITGQNIVVDGGRSLGLMGDGS